MIGSYDPLPSEATSSCVSSSPHDEILRASPLRRQALDTPVAEKARVQRVAARLAKRGLYDTASRVMRSHHVTESELLGRRRHKHVVRARYALWNAFHDELGLSYVAIAELFETGSDTIVSATTYQDSKGANVVEKNVVELVSAFVKRLGYSVLAEEIIDGAWRPETARCIGAPACPSRGQSRFRGRCFDHRRPDVQVAAR